MSVLKTLILIAALAWVGKMVVDSAQAIRSGDLVLHARPGWLALSGLCIFATYCMLIWAWLYIVTGLSGQRIRYLAGARIWFIANLGQFIPGKVWGIIQMAAMSVEAGINPVAASTASIVNTVVNIATGAAVGVITGAPIIAAYYGDQAGWAWVLAAIGIAGIVALPALIPWAFRVGRRFTSRLPDQSMPPRLIAVSALANVVAWGMYGIAFLCLNRGLVELRSYDIVQHIAVNATSYVVGYMALIFPGGIGVRETTLKGVMLAAGMASPAQAGAVAVVSRLWQLIIMLVPALIFLAYRRPLNEKDSAAG